MYNVHIIVCVHCPGGFFSEFTNGMVFLPISKLRTCTYVRIFTAGLCQVLKYKLSVGPAIKNTCSIKWSNN